MLLTKQTNNVCVKLCTRKMQECLGRTLVKESEPDPEKFAIHKEQCGYTAAKLSAV